MEPKTPEPLDFCSCGKRKNCPTFTATDGGHVLITDSEHPGMVIRLDEEETARLSAWLQLVVDRK